VFVQNSPARRGKSFGLFGQYFFAGNLFALGVSGNLEPLAALFHVFGRCGFAGLFPRQLLGVLGVLPGILPSLGFQLILPKPLLFQFVGLGPHHEVARRGKPCAQPFQQARTHYTTSCSSGISWATNWLIWSGETWFIAA